MSMTASSVLWLFSLSNRFMDATRATTVAGVVKVVRSFLATEVDEPTTVPLSGDAGGGRVVRFADWKAAVGRDLW